MLGRRTILTLAAPAFAATAFPPATRAQTPTPAPIPPQLPTLVPPPTPPVTAPPPPSTPTPATPALRPAATTPAIDKSKTYFVFFEQTIDVASIRTLRRQLATLVEAGVTEIDLVIQSPGGLVYQALAAYSFIRALPATINTHATGLVASAANILFLAGDARSADRNARFFFHASQGAVAGSVSSLQLQDRLAQFAAVNAMETQIYHDRTTLPDTEIARFEQQEVFYTADQAHQFGILQSVADLHIPGDQKARILFLD